MYVMRVEYISSVNPWSFLHDTYSGLFDLKSHDCLTLLSTSNSKLLGLYSILIWPHLTLFMYGIRTEMDFGVFTSCSLTVLSCVICTQTEASGLYTDMLLKKNHCKPQWHVSSFLSGMPKYSGTKKTLKPPLSASSPHVFTQLFSLPSSVGNMWKLCSL